MQKTRPIVLLLIILALVTAGLPVSESLAHWKSRPSASHRAKNRQMRRHSRAWWRRHRAYLRRKRARARMRQALAAADPTRGNKGLSSKPASNASALDVTPRRTASPRVPTGITPAAKLLVPAARTTPYDLTLPASWSSNGASTAGEMKFSVRSLDGRAAGTAVLAPVKPSLGDALLTARTKTLGGVPLSALRRTVIDRMVAEGGWVVNDLEREIHGRRVYVVVAQTGAAGAEPRRRTFYFAELEGRIYSLATSSPLDLDEQVAPASEKLVATFRLGEAAGPVMAKMPR